MNICDITNTIEGRIVSGFHLPDAEITHGFASDLMSDVLTLKTEDVLLITGLANLQAIRTAEMSDIKCIILARNKKATPEMIELANECNLIIIECPGSVFKTSGQLFQAGVKPVY